MNSGDHILPASSTTAPIFPTRSASPFGNGRRFALTRRVKVLLGIAGVVVACQFIRPPVNQSADPSGPQSLFGQHQAPPSVRQALEGACYDCHSNQTEYPWYANVQPAGWFLARHVARGKRAVNFSEFAQLPTKTQARRLTYAIESMTSREMPLPSYARLHDKAVLTDAQVKEITDWLETVQHALQSKPE